MSETKTVSRKPKTKKEKEEIMSEANHIGVSAIKYYMSDHFNTLAETADPGLTRANGRPPSTAHWTLPTKPSRARPPARVTRPSCSRPGAPGPSSAASLRRLPRPSVWNGTTNGHPSSIRAYAG